MLERKPQTKYVPLRVRFRSPAEQAQLERETMPISDTGPLRNEPLVPDLTNTSEAQRYVQQIRELIRLSDILRADASLEVILQQIAASTAACTGFRMLAIYLLNEQTNTVNVVACAGIPQEAERTLRESHDSTEAIYKLLRPEFRISQSYYIPHGSAQFPSDLTTVILKSEDDYEPGQWHPEDFLCIPLASMREQKMLGILSLDDPEDGKKPTEESIEVAELFASKAAIAIDNARLFQQQEEERIALEESISHLREDLEQLQSGKLYLRVRPMHQKLQPIADAINVMWDEVGAILKKMQMVTEAVDAHTRSVQDSSQMLVHDTSQQEHQVHHISQIISEVTSMIASISQSAAKLSSTAIDGVDITNKAQGTVDRAVEGMSKVREATLQSARTMKTLSESGLEINETVQAINDLSTRMHLLALNAAIEATRAGEYGQGFAVISKEMRTLANHCADAAQKVDNYIRMFQYETNIVSQSVEQSTQYVVIQSELVTETGIALDAVSEITEQLSTLIKGVCNTAANQEHGSQLVASAIGEIFRVTGDITLHMQQMQQSMTHLVELTDSLRARMSTFQLDGP